MNELKIPVALRLKLDPKDTLYLENNAYEESLLSNYERRGLDIGEDNRFSSPDKPRNYVDMVNNSNQEASIA